MMKIIGIKMEHKFNKFLKTVMEEAGGPGGPADPSAASSAKTAAAIGGSLARTKGVEALDKSKFGAATRVGAMAVGASPMDRWEFPPDASNVYSLEPRGASTLVIANFEKALASSGTRSDVEPKPPISTPPPLPEESFKFDSSFNSYIDYIVEAPLPPEGGMDMSETEIIINPNDKLWVNKMKNLIKSSRSARGGPQPIRLIDFAAGELLIITKEQITHRAKYLKASEKGIKDFETDYDFQTRWDANEGGENAEFEKEANKQLEREKAKPNVNLPKLHDALKTVFKDAGLYCGTNDQFETFKKGQASAIGTAVKGVANALNPTGIVDQGVN